MIMEVWQDGRRRGRCRSCGAAIEWALNAKTSRAVAFDDPVIAIRTQGNLLTDRVREILDTSVTTVHQCPPKPPRY